MGDSDNKLYVGGLAAETTKESLEAHFQQYGEVADCVVMIDKATNRSRGFGFVTFKDETAANAAVAAVNVVDGREISCKKAVKESPKQLVQEGGGVYNSVKIFVGGLPSTCDYEKLTGYFGRFGQIQDAVVMMDSQTQRHRGFGYVTFADPGAVEAALQSYADNKIDGKWVEVKRCIPQESMRAAGIVPGSSGAGSSGKGRGRGDLGGDRGGYSYADRYAAAWYGGGPDPYAGYRAYGMGYPSMSPDPYWAAAYQAHYGGAAYGPRYGHPASGYRSNPY